MIAIGHLIGYGAGTLNLLSIFGTLLGDTQFKQLTLIAATSLAFAVGVTSWAVGERVLILAARYEASLDSSSFKCLRLQRCGSQVWSPEDGDQDSQNDFTPTKPNTSYLLGSILGLDR